MARRGAWFGLLLLTVIAVSVGSRARAEVATGCGTADGKWCCDTGDPCQTGLVCNTNETPNRCRTCGGIGEFCCAGGLCDDTGVPGALCASDGKCLACGGPGQACCLDNHNGFSLTSGTSNGAGGGADNGGVCIGGCSCRHIGSDLNGGICVYDTPVLSARSLAGVSALLLIVGTLFLRRRQVTRTH